MNKYKVTVIIENEEENETIDFFIEANSIEEARQNIENDLDI